MKKKALLTILIFAAMLCCALGLSACDRDDNDIVAVKSITMDIDEITLTEGEDTILTVTFTPAYATNQSLEWTTSNPSVVTVDYGAVYALSEGEAIVTACSDNGKTATCKVTVKAPEPEPPTQYTVKFNANGGKFENGKNSYVVNVNEGDKLTTVDVTREGKYAFTGWYINEARTKLWDFDTDTVIDDVNLYAGWKYLNKYQTVIDALEERIKTERQYDSAFDDSGDVEILLDDSGDVEILLVFTDSDGYLCFVERDGESAHSYKTEICDFDEIAGNTEIISQIPNTALTQLNAYNDVYTSHNNAYIANTMAYKYTPAGSSNEEIIYSCVSEWELYSEGKFTTNGPWYACQIKAIVADDDGKVYECSFKAVAGVPNFNLVIGGTALSEDVGLEPIKLGETANDFYAERLKEWETAY